MNTSLPAKSVIKRNRTEPMPNYSDVLTASKTDASLDTDSRSVVKYAKRSCETYVDEQASTTDVDSGVSKYTGECFFEQQFSLKEPDVFNVVHLAAEQQLFESDEPDTLPLDITTMTWFNVPSDQAQYLMNFMQTQYCYGNPYIRNALLIMVLQMQGRMVEALGLHDKIFEQEHEITRLKIHNKELLELNETLENDNQRIPELQVLIGR